MPYPIRRKLGMKRSTPKSGVVWTLARRAGAAPAPLPPLKTQGEVQYLTGGIGKEASEAIRQAESKFPLALEFTRKAAQPDESITDVEVKVTDRNDKSVLAVRTDGPYLLAKLPDGVYIVQATYFGHTIEKMVRVAGSASARVVFVWEMKL
jgi:hypothetical protein